MKTRKVSYMFDRYSEISLTVYTVNEIYHYTHFVRIHIFTYIITYTHTLTHTHPPPPPPTHTHSFPF